MILFKDPKKCVSAYFLTLSLVSNSVVLIGQFSSVAQLHPPLCDPVDVDAHGNEEIFLFFRESFLGFLIFVLFIYLC